MLQKLTTKFEVSLLINQSKMKMRNESILKTNSLPNGISNPVQISTLERPPDPLLHRGGDPRLRQKLVRRNTAAVLCRLVLVVIEIVVVAVSAAVVSVLILQNLRPVRNVNRQRSRTTPRPAPRRRCRLPGYSGTRHTELRRLRASGGVPDVRFIELELH